MKRDINLFLTSLYATFAFDLVDPKQYLTFYSLDSNFQFNLILIISFYGIGNSCGFTYMTSLTTIQFQYTKFLKSGP
jgi:hypothetical protein